MENIDVSGMPDGAEDVKNIKKTKSKLLQGKSVAISVSENEDLENLGFTVQHLNDITIEIARYIIANDGKALYGGDLRQNGFTNLFSELSNQYKRINDDSSGFCNYFVFPNKKELSRSTRIHFLSKNIEIHEVEDPKTLSIDYSCKYDPKTNIEHRHVYSECFKSMRIEMAKDCSARVLVGGKMTNYLGYVPGVIEEALYTLRENKPLYLIGAFGGATQKLIKTLKRERVDELTNDFQYNSEFLKEFKAYVSSKCNYTDYDILKTELSQFDVNKLSELNGLSEEENEILFTSKNIHEIMYYLMKGLKSLKN